MRVMAGGFSIAISAGSGGSARVCGSWSATLVAQTKRARRFGATNAHKNREPGSILPLVELPPARRAPVACARLRAQQRGRSQIERRASEIELRDEHNKGHCAPPVSDKLVCVGMEKWIAQLERSAGSNWPHCDRSAGIGLEFGNCKLEIALAALAFGELPTSARQLDGRRESWRRQLLGGYSSQRPATQLGWTAAPKRVSKASRQSGELKETASERMVLSRQHALSVPSRSAPGGSPIGS